MKLPVYSNQGKKSGELETSDAVFSVKANSALVKQVYLALEANARQPWAHSKDRGEVRGGGKKPWKQKGTGRARHGSIRSPLWVGGGVTFGPLKTRNYKTKVNKKMNQKAVRMCLSDKAAAEKFIVLEDLKLSGKTKEMATLRGTLPGAGKSTLILTDHANEGLFLASKNLPGVHLQRAQDLNVVDLMHHQYIIATSAAVKKLEKRLAV